MKNVKLRPQIVNVNSKEPVFFPFSIKITKCSGSCNNINDPYEKLCVSDIIKYLNVRIFNLVSRTNETRYTECHEKLRQNDDKCRCECKELIDKGACDKECIWNPSECECECAKSCYVGEYLDYENCECRKSLVDKLVEECTENIYEVKIAGITLAGHENVCVYSCTIYVVLIVMIFTISIGIGAYFMYSRWYSKKRC